MAALAMAPIVMNPPAALYGLPQGSWGISYDINIGATELEPPNGWNARRCE